MPEMVKAGVPGGRFAESARSGAAGALAGLQAEMHPHGEGARGLPKTLRSSSLSAHLAASEVPTELAGGQGDHGMRMCCPGKMTSGFFICGFAASSALRLTPNRSAISLRVSPD